MGGIFRLYSNFNRKLCKQTVDCGDTDETPLSVASGLGLHCLPTSNKKDARLIWVKSILLEPDSIFSMLHSLVVPDDSCGFNVYRVLLGLDR